MFTVKSFRFFPTKGMILLLLFAASLLTTVAGPGPLDNGGTRLEIFSGQTAVPSPNDTLFFEKANSTGIFIAPVPQEFRLYDLDLDGIITEWEAREVVKDWKENDSPYAEEEIYAFIDYFFSVR